MPCLHRIALAAALLLVPTIALAQVPPGDDPPAPAEASPPPPVMSDPAPQSLAPPRPRYARAGVFELGASAGFTSAEEATGGNLTPAFGWFVADGVELSALVGAHYVRANGQGTAITSALVEPSYHLPFGRTTFGFLGLGLGGSYVDQAGLGFALAPRVGAKVVVGRAGVITPALSYQYTTLDGRQEPDEMLVVTSALSANIGYSLMW